MNMWQSIGLTIILYVVGNIVIVSSGITEASQTVYMLVLSIGGLCLMLGGVKHDQEE